MSNDMGNFVITTEADDHGLGKELSAHTRRLPGFIQRAVQQLANEIYSNVRAEAPTRGDRPRKKGESQSHTARGASWAAGNLRDAVFMEMHDGDARIGIDEIKAPYAKYVVFPTGPKKSRKLMVFPSREGGTMAGRFFRANPHNDFPLRGLNRTNVTQHVERLANRVGNLPTRT